MTTTATSRPSNLAARVRADALAYWDKYVWHHRDPRTRILHRIGSWCCIVGAVAAYATSLWWIVPIGIAVGYGFAFAGHWIVERNRPLTFNSPIRAGIANWVMFVVERFYDIEGHIERLAQSPPDTSDMDSQ
jgi:hypothetical protein